MATEISGLIVAFREDMFDPELPGSGDSSESLWTDSEIKRYIDRAQNEFCRRTMCISDATLFAPRTAVGNPYIKADPRILKPRDAYLASTGHQLEITTVRDMDEAAITCDYGLQVSKNWRAETTAGVPRILVTDDTNGKYRLYPIPAAVDTVHINAYRLPEDPAYEGGEMEIPEEWRMKLLDGIKSFAYTKQDVEVFDPVKAEIYAKRFEAVLTEASAAFRQRRRGPRRIAYGGI